MFDVFIADASATAGTINLEAHAGGSPFNVAIGLARLGGRSALLTGVSQDMLGERLVRTLKDEGVSSQYLIRSGNRTTLSMVGVDSRGQPAYVFYGLGSADCSVTPEDLPELGPEVTGFHFGSYSLVVRPVADAFSSLLNTVGHRFVSLDPNVRPTVEPDLDIWRERVAEYVPRADLIKISTEDMDGLYPGIRANALAEQWLASGVKLVVVTDGGETVSAWTQSGHVVRVAPPVTRVVDTVGAGDSFQSALLAKLSHDGGGCAASAISALDTERLEELVKFAVTAARITCQRRGADMPRSDEISLNLA